MNKDGGGKHEVCSSLNLSSDGFVEFRRLGTAVAVNMRNGQMHHVLTRRTIRLTPLEAHLWVFPTTDDPALAKSKQMEVEVEVEVERRWMRSDPFDSPTR